MMNILLILTTILFGSGIDAITNPLPNFGDVRLKYVKSFNDGRVYGILQVFFTDGTSPPTWSSVCSNNFERLFEGTTACHQLGYDECTEASKNEYRNDSDPVWLTKLDCKHIEYTHIFHCSHELIDNSTCPINGIVGLTCKRELGVKKGYEGEVALCSPDIEDQNYTVQSVSTGIVSIYLNGDFGALSFDKTDKALTEEITHYRGNLICQQQGFQQVVSGSIQTVASYKAAGYQFNKCETQGDRIHLAFAWISNKNLTCESRNYNDDDCTSTINDPCFSCCYTRPDIYDKLRPSFDDYVVLQCIFGVYSMIKSVPYGNKSTCEFPEPSENGGEHILQYNSICAAGQPHTHNCGYYKDWLILSILLIFFYSIIIYGYIIIWLVKYIKKYQRKKEYIDIGNDQQRPNPQEN